MNSSAADPSDGGRTALDSYDDALVSIITPAYRAAAFIEATIASVQAQTYPSFEMLIVDDCSPDDTALIVQRATESDNRIRLLRQSRNAGPAAARNRALAQARGRWIAFLDSDDLWLPRKLELQLPFHLASGAKISCTDFRRISENSVRTGHLVAAPEWLDYRRLLCNTGIPTSTVLVDRNLAGPFTMKETRCDDYACWLDLLRPGGFAVGLRKDLMRYRVLQTSWSRNKVHYSRHVWKTYREVERLGLVQSAWSFANYAVRGVWKYSRF